MSMGGMGKGSKLVNAVKRSLNKRDGDAEQMALVVTYFAVI
jgi:hypothetical protein